MLGEKLHLGPVLHPAQGPKDRHDDDVEDFVVVKLPRAVSHFAPGTYQSLPNISTSVPNFFFAGDGEEAVT